MRVGVLSAKTAEQVHDDVSGFAERYAEDWSVWLAARDDARAELFGRILRKWQATRPKAMRRLEREAHHDAPFLDDLLTRATQSIGTLGSLTVMTVAARTDAQDRALNTLWDIFLRLPITGNASGVGITKAILLLTDGRIGPALDSKVRKKLRVRQPATCRAWIQILEIVAEDIAEFESASGELTRAVPARFARLAYGRLYDMALGPR